MSNYIDRNLGKDEVVVMYAKKNWLYMIPGFLTFILFLAIAIVFQVFLTDALDMSSLGLIGWILFAFAGVLPLIVRLVKFLSINLVITNKRLIGKEGFLRLNTVDVHIDKLDSVGVSAGFWGNILHYYTLTVLSVGGSGASTRPSRKGNGGVLFLGISNAQEFKNVVTAAIEQHADEARKKQAEEIARAMGR